MTRSAKILIVEDSHVVARDIRQQLSKAGYSVVGTTAFGEDALALAQALRPDLVLMDIRLEGVMDGIEAAQQIREHCRIPVIFLTAYVDEETLRRASVTEPFGYILKPFEDTQLRTVIEMAFHKHAAELKLRESERRYAATLLSIGDAVIATDGQARVTFMNPVAERLTGWSQEEARGRPLPEIFVVMNEETSEMGGDPAAEVLRMGKTVGSADHTVLLTRDGREVPIDDCGSPIIDDHGIATGAVLVFRDITQRRQSEEALRKAQEDLARVARLTTMGELTASIAHEVAQPLMAIVTNADTCLRYLGAANPNLDEARKAAERIVRDGHRAGDIIKSIRVMAGQSSGERTALDINDAIRSVLLLMRSELRQHDVTVEADLSPDLEPIIGDWVQWQQVILNLIVNGIEAMSSLTGCKRVLRIGSHRMDESDEAVITIADTGEGIGPGAAGRLFDAFFTTKPKGLGLGLSICRSIVEAHGGRIWVSPNRPQGSIFHLAVPLGRNRIST